MPLGIFLRRPPRHQGHAQLLTTERIEEKWFVYDETASGRAVYNYYRDYDPATGRYLQPDPIGLAGGVNPYTYVENNPLRFVDPLGLTSNKRSPGLCNGTDCVEPPFDPSSKDPKPSPQPDREKKKKRGVDCTDQPTFHACMSCCSTIQGQLGSSTGMGGGCAESCMRKEGITRGPVPPSCPAN